MILSSNLVTHLSERCNEEKATTHLAYFYCDFRSNEPQDPINIIGSLTSQLCSQLSCFPNELCSAFDSSMNNSGQRRRPHFSALKQTIEVLSSDRRIILLLDALDECEGKSDLLQFISALATDVPRISILVTSRDDPEVKSSLSLFPCVRLDNCLEEVDRDIQSYISYRLDTDPKLQWLNATVKADITQTLRSKSSGM